ncbi:MAG: TonB-dependent receptor, partial [Bacteroidales bacterium]|nr:TonB-dependent receptor [Bacteroidales bacterium]
LKSGDFLDAHITDAQELITKRPGIEIMDGQASVRGGSGFSYGAGSRVMALIDGLPVIAPDAGSIKWQFLPLENIEQIEIIKGASSVLYGSSALNGVINFRSADAGLVPKTRFYLESGIFTGPSDRNWLWWDNPRIYSSGSFMHLRKAGNTDLGIGAFISLDNGYRKLNEENLGRLSIRLKHLNSKIRGLTYGLNLNGGYTGKTDFVLWEDAEKGALKQDTATASKLYGTFLAADPFISLKRGGALAHDLRMRFQSFENTFPVRTNNNSLALSWYAEYQLNWKLNNIFGITAGLAEQWSKVFSNFYGDHSQLNIAGFAQAEAVPLRTLRLTAGFRAEQNFLDGEAGRTVPVFRAGMNWQAAEFSFIRASFGQGYRYPSIAEKFASTTLGSVKIYPNPSVEPETGWNGEIGFKQGLLAGKVRGEADISIFMSQNDDMIEYLFSIYPDPVTGEFGFGFRATNVEQARIYGGEIEFSLARPAGSGNVYLSGGYTYIYPVEYDPNTSENTGIWLKYRRKHSLKLSAGTVIGSFDAALSLYARSKILNIDDVFLNPLTRESILPGFYDYWLENNKGYISLDCNAGYKISRTLKLSLAVKNITNTEYMGRPGDIQPHRNLSLRLSGEF